MNKIIVDKEDIELKKITQKLEVSTISSKGPFGITKINIKVLKSCDLEINYNLDNTKLDIEIEVNPNVNLNLYEYTYGTKGKVQYTFNIDTNSIINNHKFVNTLAVREMIIVNLNGEKSSINYNFKSVCKDKETYDLIINHNAKETNSNIKNNAINIEDGKISFQVSSYVPRGIKNCIVNQSNRIINFTNNKCEIRPNLYIDEFDTTANHSALIGGFNLGEMFYLQSRGINEIDANKLLVTGFLLSDLSNKYLTNKILKTIKEYWR